MTPIDFSHQPQSAPQSMHESNLSTDNIELPSALFKDDIDSFPQLSAPNTCPSQTAGPFSLSNLQQIPLPNLYQCWACGQLNPITTFPQSGGEAHAFSSILNDVYESQGTEAENEYKRRKKM